MTEPAKPNTVVAVVLAIVAAAGMAYACIAQSWLHNPRTKQQLTVGFGLLSNYECQGEECTRMSNRELVAAWQKQLADVRERAKQDAADPQTQAFVAQAMQELKVTSAFPTLGYVTLGCAALAALSLLACAGLVLAKKRVAWPIMPTTTAILGIAVGLITGCVFVALKPGPPGYVGVHLGFFAFGAGVIVGIIAALMMNKLLRPHDPDLLEDSMNPEQY